MRTDLLIAGPRSFRGCTSYSDFAPREVGRFPLDALLDVMAGRSVPVGVDRCVVAKPWRLDRASGGTLRSTSDKLSGRTLYGRGRWRSPVRASRKYICTVAGSGSRTRARNCDNLSTYDWSAAKVILEAQSLLSPQCHLPIVPEELTEQPLPHARLRKQDAVQEVL